jgi:hypothetical protein
MRVVSVTRHIIALADAERFVRHIFVPGELLSRGGVTPEASRLTHQRTLMLLEMPKIRGFRYLKTSSLSGQGRQEIREGDNPGHNDPGNAKALQVDTIASKAEILVQLKQVRQEQALPLLSG